MMTPKLLVIPSWYPTTDSPVTGSFCKDQAELMSPGFDTRVIYPSLSLVSKINTLKRPMAANGAAIHKNLMGKIEGAGVAARVSTFMPAHRRWAFLAGSCRNYLQSLEREGWRPDLIHAHGTMHAGVVAESLGRFLGVPYIITEHHSLLVANFDRDSWLMYKKALEGSKIVMVVSNELKKMILMNGVRCQTEVVGNLLDEDLFKPGKTERQDNQFHILFMAVPAWTKDIPTFIKALQGLRAAGCQDFQATLVIPDITADLSRQDVAVLCKQAGVMENCRISGSVPHDQIPGLINSSDVLVSTSITETFGLSVAEAIMCGKPVIATRSGGVEDFVNPSNGVLVNIGDHHAISEALIQLIRGKIGFDTEAIRAVMISRFGKKVFKDRISEIYNRFIHDQRHKSLSTPS